MAATTLDAAGSGTRALRRVLHHFVRSARKDLQQTTPTDEAVHEARKAIKKSRTALRLLRPALRKPRYQRANRTLRDAARVLNALRDARVLVQTLADLRRRTSALHANRAATRLAARLQQEFSDAQRRLNARTLRDQCRTLHRMERRAERLPVGRRGWSVLGPAMRRIYREGRRVLPTAAGHPPDAALHEWRKQVKHLRYALKMLGPVQPSLFGGLARQAAAIASQLGEAHDLALLQARATLLKARSGPGHRRLLQVIEQARAECAFGALVRGERLFQPSPREFEHQLSHAWHRWRRRQG